MNQESIDLIQSDCAQVTANNKHMYLSPLQSQHILITGGTGFLGTWITEIVIFLNKEFSFNTKLTLIARNAHKFRERYPHLANEPSVTLIDKDVRTLVDFPNDVNYVIHAASNPDGREHNLNPLLVIDSITNGTSNVLEISSRLSNLNKIINISSGLIYGKQPLDLESIPETYVGSVDCSQINSIYSEAKRLGETIGTAYRTQNRLPVVTVRPFTFAGPYQLLDRPWAINNFIKESLSGGPIRILGSGETMRSYMYGSDAAFWVLSMLANGKIGASYNLGSPHAISIKKLAEKIAKELSPSPMIISQSINDVDANISRFIPDVSLAMKTLNLEITTNVEDGISKTIKWNKFQVR